VALTNYLEKSGQKKQGDPRGVKLVKRWAKGITVLLRAGEKREVIEGR